mmetsp:Transcript_60788/g.192876  ORF Transcript_60788/g.192876 Transcript_60788/m.192876 type:complete len:333 (-) Transcript_60788:124-1122(-)
MRRPLPDPSRIVITVHPLYPWKRPTSESFRHSSTAMFHATPYEYSWRFCQWIEWLSFRLYSHSQKTFARATTLAEMSVRTMPAVVSSATPIRWSSSRCELCTASDSSRAAGRRGVWWWAPKCPTCSPMCPMTLPPAPSALAAAPAPRSPAASAAPNAAGAGGGGKPVATSPSGSENPSPTTTSPRMRTPMAAHWCHASTFFMMTRSRRAVYRILMFHMIPYVPGSMYCIITNAALFTIMYSIPGTAYLTLSFHSNLTLAEASESLALVVPMTETSSLVISVKRTADTCEYCITPPTLEAATHICPKLSTTTSVRTSPAYAEPFSAIPPGYAI